MICSWTRMSRALSSTESAMDGCFSKELQAIDSAVETLRFALLTDQNSKSDVRLPRTTAMPPWLDNPDIVASSGYGNWCRYDATKNRE